MTVRLAADIGGTFTDLVLLDEDGNLHVHKTPSTPRDFTEGILLGVERIVADQGLDQGLAAVDTFVHGATVVLNALLQLQLPKTGLITTSGFRDVLEIMRTNNPWMYDLSYVKPAPVVPRHLRLEVHERIRHTGEVGSPCATRTSSPQRGGLRRRVSKLLASVCCTRTRTPRTSAESPSCCKTLCLAGRSVSHRMSSRVASSNGHRRPASMLQPRPSSRRTSAGWAGSSLIAVSDAICLSCSRTAGS